MALQPLKPFAPPPDLLVYVPQGVTPHLLMSIFFYFVIAYWLVYTGIAIYHWLAYAHNPALATPAIATHCIVSLAIIGFCLTGIL